MWKHLQISPLLAVWTIRRSLADEIQRSNWNIYILLDYLWTSSEAVFWFWFIGLTLNRQANAQACHQPGPLSVSVFICFICSLISSTIASESRFISIPPLLAGVTSSFVFSHLPSYCEVNKSNTGGGSGIIKDLCEHWEVCYWLRRLRSYQATWCPKSYYSSRQHSSSREGRPVSR